MGESWEFHHIGVTVSDIDKAVEHYQSLGMVTLQPVYTLDSSTFTDFEVYGKPPETPVKARKVKMRFVHIGSFQLELMQPTEGESPQKEFLDSKGEGVDHIAFTVGDLDRETAKLVEKGFPVILTGKLQASSVFAYFDTRKVGNVIIELIQQQ